MSCPLFIPSDSPSGGIFIFQYIPCQFCKAQRVPVEGDQKPVPGLGRGIVKPEIFPFEITDGKVFPAFEIIAEGIPVFPEIKGQGLGRFKALLLKTTEIEAVSKEVDSVLQGWVCRNVIDLVSPDVDPVRVRVKIHL